MKAGVIAGTIVDAQMGVDLLKSNNIETIYLPLSQNCVEQSKLQYFSKDKLEDLVINKIEEATKEGSDIIFIYCNSLSCAIDYKKISKEMDIEIITPLETYMNLPKDSKNIAILTANGFSAYTIDKIISESNENKRTISVGNIGIVELIEKGLSPEEVVDKLDIKGFLKYLENIKIEEYKIDTLILGCTHFQYIKDEIRKNTSLKIINPSDDMVNKIKEADLRGRL